MPENEELQACYECYISVERYKGECQNLMTLIDFSVVSLPSVIRVCDQTVNCCLMKQQKKLNEQLSREIFRLFRIRFARQ